MLLPSQTFHCQETLVNIYNCQDLKYEEQHITQMVPVSMMMFRRPIRTHLLAPRQRPHRHLWHATSYVSYEFSGKVREIKPENTS